MAFQPTLLWALVVLPFAGFLVNGTLALGAARARARGEGGSGWIRASQSAPTWVGPGVVGAAFAVALVNFVGLLGGETHGPVVETYFTWLAAGSLQIDAALQLDALSMVMTLVVTGVGFLIHLYSVGYMGEDSGYARYFAYLNLFIFFMLTLVLASSFPLMFVGWEGVGLCSYLLIGFWFEEKPNADAGKKAFIVNRIGDAGFLVAIFLLATTAGTLDFVPIFQDAPTLYEYGGATVTAITLFLFLGAVGKSAQIPLYVWLPDAMAGPTPVSALIHAATMVTAGVYMVARAGVLYALAPVAGAVVAGVGVLTALFAATIALAQYDIKKVLAYSTISQLGYMFLGVGVGAYAAGVFHLVTHAFFKALLFLGAGAVIHALHHALHSTDKDWDAQDMRNMGGLAKRMPVTWLTMWAATLAIAGVWPFAGFFSKDEIIWQTAVRAGGPLSGLYTAYWVIALLAAILTAVYMTRLMVLTFHGENRTGREEERHLHEAPWVMTLPLAILGVLSLVGGWINVPEALRESVVGLFGLLPSAEWLHHFMEPVTADAHHVLAEHVGEGVHAAPAGGGEVLWALLSTGVAVAAVVAVYRVVGGWSYRPAVEADEPREGLRRILYRKWYVDELYDAVVVRPLARLSRISWRWVDDGIIDRTVNAVGYLTRGVGWIGSRFETGQINTYALVFATAVLVILGVVAF